MKVAVGVHGRFHAFDLAKAMIDLGHEVTVFTNYPLAIAARWGIPASSLRTFPAHGVISRIKNFLKSSPGDWSDEFLHRSFGVWFANQISKQEWDLIHCFSGIAEEMLLATMGKECVRQVVRGSAYIRTQNQLLFEEEIRAGVSIPRPSDWMIGREEREYSLADFVTVLSSFAERSFGDRLPAGKVRVVPLGVDTGRFAATPAQIEARKRRILSGQPLNILFVGSFSYRKGAIDFARVATDLAPSGRFTFRFVGDLLNETAAIRKDCRNLVQFSHRVPQSQLPRVYESGDVFLFPTIEDGFGAVIAQAQAAGLPVIATTNSGAPDFVFANENGWIVPIRDPQAIVNRLVWCDHNRERLAEMVTSATFRAVSRPWVAVASELLHFASVSKQNAT